MTNYDPEAVSAGSATQTTPPLKNRYFWSQTSNF